MSWVYSFWIDDWVMLCKSCCLVAWGNYLNCNNIGWCHRCNIAWSIWMSALCTISQPTNKSTSVIHQQIQTNLTCCSVKQPHPLPSGQCISLLSWKDCGLLFETPSDDSSDIKNVVILSVVNLRLMWWPSLKCNWAEWSWITPTDRRVTLRCMIETRKARDLYCWASLGTTHSFQEADLEEVT